ncbi:MAG TPA: CcmD family protein [Longimicrobiales bacterium]
MSEWGYVIAAYALTWVAVGGYVVYLRVRTARARTALDTAPAQEAEP